MLFWSTSRTPSSNLSEGQRDGDFNIWIHSQLVYGNIGCGWWCCVSEWYGISGAGPEGTFDETIAAKLSGKEAAANFLSLNALDSIRNRVAVGRPMWIAGNGCFQSGIDQSQASSAHLS